MSHFFEEENGERKIRISAKLENIDPLVEKIVENVRNKKVDKKVKYQIMLACEEALVNIVQYAYPDMDGNIKVVIKEPLDSDKIIIKIMDNGIPFNPLSVPDPDLNMPLEIRDVGGLGIFLMKEIMDDVRYERKGEENILTFEKQI